MSVVCVAVCVRQLGGGDVNKDPCADPLTPFHHPHRRRGARAGQVGVVCFAKTWRFVSSRNKQKPTPSLFPNPHSVLINGIGQGFCGPPVPSGNVTAPGGSLPCNWPVIKAKAGSCLKPKTRLRLINAAAFAPIDVFIDKVQTWVVEIDSIGRWFSGKAWRVGAEVSAFDAHQTSPNLSTQPSTRSTSRAPSASMWASACRWPSARTTFRTAPS